MRRALAERYRLIDALLKKSGKGPLSKKVPSQGSFHIRAIGTMAPIKVGAGTRTVKLCDGLEGIEKEVQAIWLG